MVKQQDFAHVRERLPPWTSADVARFIEEDEVNGPLLKKIRMAGNFSYACGAAGGVGAAAMMLRSSKNVPGAVMTGAVGVVAGLLAGDQVPRFAMGIRNMETAKVNAAFLDWWSAENNPKKK